MKKIKRLFVGMLAVGLIAVLSGFALNTNNAAGLTKDFGCGLFDGYGGFVYTTESIDVTNHGGNTTLVCKAKGVDTPGYTVKTEGFLCGTFGGLTNNSVNHVSASGNATLRCQIKK